MDMLPPTSSALSTPNSSVVSSFSHIVSTKLTTENFPMWKVQISAYLRGHDIFQYVDGSLICPPKVLSNQTTVNPAYSAWKRTDQLVLSILFSSLSDSVISHVLTATTSHELWNSLASLFTSHSQAKQFQTHFQLANLTRGDQSITSYFGKVRALADILAVTGSPLNDQDFVSYLLTGLGPSYESFITSVTTRAEPITSHELFQLLLVHESRISHNTRSFSSMEPTVNLTTSGGHNQRGKNFPRGGHFGRNGRGRSNFNNRGGRTNSYPSSNNQSYSSNNRPTCQVCTKPGHVALQCHHRFNHSYQYEAPPSLSANFTTSNSYSDGNWYPDSAATDHITNNLQNLNLSSESYSDGDQIRVGDGIALPIQNIGDSNLFSASSSFKLRNLLHVPLITKNLVSVCKFCTDNRCFFEFHASHFSVKDTCPNHNGLYVFPSAPVSSSPSTHIGERTSVAQWHRRLGHPSLTLVSRILHQKCL
ncbi:hypothetical protein F2P56_002068, partial [Juglans regia]